MSDGRGAGQSVALLPTRRIKSRACNNAGRPVHMPAALPPGVAFRPGTMATDYRIRRAAGVIMWHLSRKHTLSTALAAASDRERELTTAQLQYATDWAGAALLFRDMAASCDKSCTLGELLDKSGLIKFVMEN